MATNLPTSRGRASNGKDYTVECTISDVAPFTVHFRQPKDMAGRYGFDYPRDADRYPIEEIFEDASGNKFRDNRKLYIGNIANFNNIYLQGATFSPKLKSKDYLPAWLVIFPHTTTAVYKGGSDMHSHGIKLDLEIQQLIGNNSSLSASKFKTLEFVSSNPSKLIVSPTTIPITNILAKGRTSTTVNDVKGKTRNDYKAERAVLIKGVKNQLLTKHESIAVYAISNKCKALVGELMVHKNNVTYKADLVFVDVTSSSRSTVNSASDIEYYLKFKSFNQALIRAEKVVQSKFELHKLSQHSKVSNFLTKYNSGVTSIQRSHGLNPRAALNKFLDVIKTELIEIYELYGEHNPKDINGNKIKLNNTYNLKTFIFNTDLNAGSINGFAPGDVVGGKFKWGNIIIIFKQANTNKDTLVHEIGHSLTLRHVFDSKAPYVFYQGYSDKVMDYTWYRGRRNAINKNKRILFPRYQWYKMQNDKSTYKL